MLFYLPAGANAEEEVGRDEYRTSCAACHGEDGRGNGTIAAYLTVKPSDLTLIARKNGGTFPVKQVFETIGGRRAVRVHGDSAMPIWGKRYRMGAFSETGGEFEAMARILMLVYYLQTIQQE